MRREGEAKMAETSAADPKRGHRLNELVVIVRAHADAVGTMVLARDYESALSQLDTIGTHLNELRESLEAARSKR